MTSTPRHPARPGRALLLLGALALLLVVPGGAAHAVCEHADEASPAGHHCAICRHLADSTPVLTVTTTITAPTVIDLACTAFVLRSSSHDTPTPRGRAPPAQVPVS